MLLNHWSIIKPTFLKISSQESHLQTTFLQVYNLKYYYYYLYSKMR
jgi:hypothetical protein